LRPLEHLDAFQVQERQQHAAAAPAVHAVDVDAHRRIGADAEVAGFDAAQTERRLRRLHPVHHQAGHEGVDVAQVLGCYVIQQRLIHHLQRDRYVLQFLLAALCGDDQPVEFDRFVLRRCGCPLRRRGLRLRRSCRPQHRAAAQRGDRDHELLSTQTHWSLPVVRLFVVQSSCAVAAHRPSPPCRRAL
jgi:hypothetical protein